MTVRLCVEDNEVRGELALAVPPGTPAARRDRMVDDVLTDPMFDLAAELGVVLAADPHAYARPLDGRDEQGRTRFEVRGRTEGGRLMPVKRGKLRGQRG